MPVAVITGASRGLGAALAHALDARGWDLVVDARDADALAAAVGSSTAHAVPGDVTDPAHRQALADAAAGLGGADLLVNNASTLGASPMPPLADLTARRPRRRAAHQRGRPARPDPRAAPPARRAAAAGS